MGLYDSICQQGHTSPACSPTCRSAIEAAFVANYAVTQIDRLFAEFAQSAQSMISHPEWID